MGLEGSQSYHVLNKELGLVKLLFHDVFHLDGAQQDETKIRVGDGMWQGAGRERAERRTHHHLTWVLQNIWRKTEEEKLELELSELVARTHTHSEELVTCYFFCAIVFMEGAPRLWQQRTETIIRRIARFRTALSMAARRIFTSIHLTIFPIASARLVATFLARLPRSYLQRRIAHGNKYGGLFCTYTHAAA